MDPLKIKSMIAIIKKIDAHLSGATENKQHNTSQPLSQVLQLLPSTLKNPFRALSKRRVTHGLLMMLSVVLMQLNSFYHPQITEAHRFRLSALTSLVILLYTILKFWVLWRWLLFFCRNFRSCDFNFSLSKWEELYTSWYAMNLISR